MLFAALGVSQSGPLRYLGRLHGRELYVIEHGDIGPYFLHWVFGDGSLQCLRANFAWKRCEGQQVSCFVLTPTQSARLALDVPRFA